MKVRDSPVVGVTRYRNEAELSRIRRKRNSARFRNGKNDWISDYSPARLIMRPPPLNLFLYLT